MLFKETFFSLSIFLSSVCVDSKQWKAINAVNFMGFLKWVAVDSFFFELKFQLNINRKFEIKPLAKREEKKHILVNVTVPAFYHSFSYYLLESQALMHIKYAFITFDRNIENTSTIHLFQAHCCFSSI